LTPTENYKITNYKILFRKSKEKRAFWRSKYRCGANEEMASKECGICSYSFFGAYDYHN
jgi:hypothetical protein